MPDPGRPGEAFERHVEIALPPLSTPRGGISRYNNYKKITVNFRPKNWPDENFWIGKIDDPTDAKFIRDACHHYLGQPPMHFPSATFTFPALRCPGTTTPLTSFEMCLKYATSIARDKEKRHLRKEYREAVRSLVTELVRTDAVQTVLQQFRNGPGPAVQTVLQQFENGPPVVATLENIAHVPGFNLSESGLQSDLTPVEDDRRYADSCLIDIEYTGAHIHLDGDEDAPSKATLPLQHASGSEDSDKVDDRSAFMKALKQGGGSHSEYLEFLCTNGPTLLTRSLDDKHEISGLLLIMADNLKRAQAPADSAEQPEWDMLDMRMWYVSLSELMKEMKAVQEHTPSSVIDDKSGVYVITSSPYDAFLRALAAEVADRSG